MRTRLIVLKLITSVSLVAYAALQTNHSFSAEIVDRGQGVEGALRQTVSVDDLIHLVDIGSTYFGELSVSPNGKSVVFQLVSADLASNSYDSAWYRLTLDSLNTVQRIGHGGDPIFRRLPYGFPNGNFIAVKAKWSPDSEYVAYRLQTDGKIGIWAHQNGRENHRRLISVEADIENFEWSRDGKKILYEVGVSRERKQARDQSESQLGYLYTDSFVPYSGLKPFWSSCGYSPFPEGNSTDRQCKLSLWVKDLVTGEQRPATSAETHEYRRHSKPYGDGLPGNDFVVMLANRIGEDDRVGIVADMSPEIERLDASDWRLGIFQGGLENDPVFCVHDACAGRIRMLESDGGGNEIIFVRKEGVAFSETAVYGWEPGADKLRRIFSTQDTLDACVSNMQGLICLLEGPLQPRKVVSINTRTGALQTLFDPNPSFEERSFPKVERIEWMDGFGNPTFGHLAYPTGYRAGVKYPLVVVQYNSQGLLRGGTGDEYPILPLTDEGFFVLRFDRPSDWTYEGPPRDAIATERDEWVELYERRRATTALEKIIRQLDKRDLIDASRIAITGLSDGAETVYFSLFHHDLFAVAIASSGAWSESFYYLAAPVYRRLLNQIGLGTPDSPKDKYWDDISITENVSNVWAPLLINVADRELLAGAVDTYVSMSEAEKPVEMYVYPDEYHIKWQPAHRYNVYRRNIQWLKFWLQGEEVTDPVDENQYVRWQKLRNQHEANLAERVNNRSRYGLR